MRLPSRPAGRAAAVALLIAAGYLAITRNVAAAVAKTDPVTAASIADDRRVAARAALALSNAAKTDGDRQAAVRMARRALAGDATAVPAVVVLGLNAGLAGDEKASEAWFAYSSRLSRRDLMTQLYFIESAVAAGDIPRALRHYDIALRTSDAASETLFPILRSAIADPAIVTNLSSTLAQKPLWGPPFLADLAGKGPDFTSAAALFIEARKRGVSVPADVDASLLTNLVSRGAVSTAWRYYLFTHPGAAKAIVRNADFDVAADGSSPFDWHFTSGEGVSAGLADGGNGGVLEFNLAATVSSQAARQTIFLSAGTYDLQSVVVTSSQTVGAGPYWELKCVDGRLAGTLELGRPATSPSRFSSRVVVPSNCPVLTLTLSVRSSDDVEGASGQLDSVAIVKRQ